MWARLARALLELGETGEAIAALKRQGSIEDTSAVWNNLGVAYYRKRDLKKAAEAYKYAVEKDAPKQTRSALLALRNMTALLSNTRQLDALLKLTTAVIAEDVDHNRRTPAGTRCVSNAGGGDADVPHGSARRPRPERGALLVHEAGACRAVGGGLRR